MPRMNIYVTEDLKRRMDKLRKTPNWSAVASAAFEVELGRLAAERKCENMSEVIQRLKASKIKAVSADRQKGLEAGKAWAKKHAEYQQLQSLAEHMERAESAGDEAFMIGEGSAFSGREHFVFVIEPEYDGERRRANEFWKDTLGDHWKQVATDEFVQAFAEGAHEVFSEIREEL